MEVFVSYRKVNRNLVDELVSDLEDMGHDVTYDQQFEGEQAWWEAHLQKIQDCQVFIYALTPQSLESYACALEYTYAHALNRNILAVGLNPGISVDNIPTVLKQYPFLDYSAKDKQAFKLLTAAINDLPASSELPDPLPTAPERPISPLVAIRDRLDSPVLSHEDQVSILHELKGFMTNPDYMGDARELLERLSEHPSLLAVVLRDILSTLSTAPPPTNVTISMPEPPTPLTEAEPVAATLPDGGAGGLLTDGEPEAEPIAEVESEAAPDVITRVAGKLISGAFDTTDGTWELSATALAFTPQTFDEATVEIAVDTISEMNATRSLLRRVIEIKTKDGGEYTISTGDQDREQLISMIQNLQAEISDTED